MIKNEQVAAARAAEGGVSGIEVWVRGGGTAPSSPGFAAANDLVGKSDVEVREAIGDKFPKHIYHSIVCIGALIESLITGRLMRWAPRTWARGPRSH
jgi:hypothetical protein